MMTKEEIIEEAKICYNNCRIILQGLCDITREMEADFDEKTAFEQFDYLLQAILFSQSIADGDFCDAEKEFIEQILASVDLFAHVKAEGFEDLSWEKVFQLSTEDQGRLALSINTALETYANDFALPFAILDAGTTTNSLKDLSRNLAGIGILLSSVDGEITEDELEVFNHYTDSLIIEKWETIKGIAEIMLEGTEETSDEEEEDE